MWIYGLFLYLCVLKNLIFLTSEALKIFWGPQKRPNFWILDLWVCLKKVGLRATVLKFLSCIYYPCTQFYSDINFGDRLYSKEKRRGELKSYSNWKPPYDLLNKILLWFLWVGAFYKLHHPWISWWDWMHFYIEGGNMRNDVLPRAIYCYV